MLTLYRALDEKFAFFHRTNRLKPNHTKPHLGGMDAERWTEKLRCPTCRQTGNVSLTMTDRGEIPVVNEVTEGFKVIHTQFGPVFHCTVCDVPAEP